MYNYRSRSKCFFFCFRHMLRMTITDVFFAEKCILGITLTVTLM